MKKWAVFACVVLLLLTSCTDQPSRTSKMPKQQQPPNTEQQHSSTFIPPQLQSTSQTFHFVADWLNATTILYVEKNGQHYQVKTFQMDTGQSDVLYEDSAIISEVIVHPSKEQLLIHTSTTPSSAIIKVIELDGTMLDSIELESSEVEIEWNDLDPSLILFTSFYEDWSFDLFYYNGHTQSLTMLQLFDPFPKWLGADSLLTMPSTEHALDGGELYRYDIATGVQKPMGISNTIFYDTFENALLTVQIENEGTAMYRLRESDGEVLEEWEMPAVSNYSEWYVPAMSWISEQELFIVTGAESGQVDELQEKFTLVHLKKNILKHHALKARPYETISCAPAGQQCLVGPIGEKLLTIDDLMQRTWLTIQNE